MSKKSISIKMLDMVSDPIKIEIWDEIRRGVNLTAKELAKKLNLKKTNIYYHLNQLEESRLIVSENHILPGKNLLQKTYKINEETYSPKEFKIRRELYETQERMREAFLFQYHIVVMHLNRKILQISKMTNEEVKELIKQDKHSLAKILYIRDNDVALVRETFDSLVSTIFEKHREDTSPSEIWEDITHAMILGLLPMEKDRK
ncbi:MAG: helix-turn-helix transcriptional regulator [Candidatus Heimdallarchaeota archaeon]|nr:helix-turn-helix transcriptional regulator [Candidatus Heimdallarchaeota archaeon]MCK4254498.1 helix-turn-helix transcriptional regulator [Candidatus Heimdallarchaeota archaeon]